MRTPEGIAKSQVAKSLASSELAGDIIWFERMNSLAIHRDGMHISGCRPGTFDYVAVFKSKHGGLALAFIEVKRVDKPASLSDSQTAFKAKYNGKHRDIHFWLVQSGKEVSKLITIHAYNRLDDVEFTP